MIKSSFKKVEKKGADTSTAYFGHPELDAVLKNNLRKGHLILIQEDHPTTIYASFLRYFVGSNFHKSLYTLVFQSLVHEKWSAIVPEEIKEKPAQKLQKNNPVQKSEIAWRYDSMNITLNTLAVSDSIPFMDLSKSINLETTKKLVKTFDYGRLQLKDLYTKIQGEIMNTLSDSNDTALRKLVLTGFPEELLLHKDFQLFLHSLRCLARTSHLLVVLTVRPILPLEKDLLDTLVSYSDYYMKINSDLGQAYSHFDGTLALIKEVQVGNIEASQRGITVWGIKAKGKKEVRIEPLYENLQQQEARKQQQHPCGVTAKQSLQF